MIKMKVNNYKYNECKFFKYQFICVHSFLILQHKKTKMKNTKNISKYLKIKFLIKDLIREVKKKQT